MYLYKHKKYGFKAAVKMMRLLSSTRASSSDQMFREYKTMKMLKHKNIISLQHGFVSRDAFVLIMEYAEGGDLHQYVQKNGRLQECEARTFMR